MNGVNEHRQAWHRYYHDRAQRRQDQAACAARAATEQAADPVAKVKDGFAAARAAEKAFDEREPELTYEQWVEANT